MVPATQPPWAKGEFWESWLLAWFTQTSAMGVMALSLDEFLDDDFLVDVDEELRFRRPAAAFCCRRRSFSCMSTRIISRW